MADYARRERHFTRIEYVLESPTVWAEVEKIFAAIRRDLSDERLYDDTAHVEARDDEIVVWYEPDGGTS